MSVIYETNHLPAYLYTTLKICVALFDGVPTELTFTVVTHQTWRGKLVTLIFTLADEPDTLELLTGAPPTSVTVDTSTLIPEAGIAEVSVTVNANVAPGFCTAFPALCVNTIC